MLNLRVAFISFSNNPDLQYYLYNSAKYVNEIGHEAITIGSNNVKVSTNLGQINYLLNVPERPGVSFDTIKNYRQAQAKVKSIITEFKPNVIHFISKHTWNYFMIMMIRKTNRNIKIVHTMHDPIGHNGEKAQKKVVLYNKIIKNRVDGIVVHSNISYRQAVQKLCVKSPIVKAPLGEMEWLNYEKSRRTKNVLIFGRLNAYKGLEYIPKISSSLYSFDKSIRIVIAGKFSKDIDQKLIKDIKQCENVILYNRFIPEDDVEELFFNSDLVLITHTSISQSGVLLESYRHSRPVVAFDIEGVEEFIINSKTGLLVNKFDIEKYAEQIYRTINSENMLDTLSINAHKYGRELFSTEKMCKDFVEFYQSIL